MGTLPYANQAQPGLDSAAAGVVRGTAHPSRRNGFFPGRRLLGEVVGISNLYALFARETIAYDW